MNLAPLLITAAITLLSGSTAVVLAVLRRNGPAVEALSRIALLGATTLFALANPPT